MITVDDIAGVVGDRLAATSDFVLSCPGGSWFGRGPDAPTAYPYTVFQIESAGTEVFSGDAMLQTFNVRLAAYCPIGASGVDPQAVEQAMNSALCTTGANTALQAVTMRNGTEHILHGRPLDPEGEFDPTLREGRDVFVAGLLVEVLCQGDRSVS